MSARTARRPARIAPAAEVCEPRRLLTTFVVTDGGDATDDADGLLTFREALAAAEAEAGADVVTFADGVDTVTLAADLGVYTDDLTVAGGGDGVTIRHRGRAGAELAGGTFLFSNLTLTGADAASRESPFGGALWLTGGADVTLNEVAFLDNAARFGGGVSVDDAGTTLTMVGGLFLGNTASVRGGAADFGFLTAGTFTGVTFRGNLARSGGGVGAYEAKVTFTDVLAYENVAGVRDGELVGDGVGGFFASSGDAEETGNFSITTVTGGRFTRNYATDDGGAFHMFDRGRLTVADAVFSKNQALGRATLQRGATGGGAINLFEEELTVADTVFFRNVAAAESQALQELLGDDLDLGDLPNERPGGPKGGAVSSLGAVTVADSKFNRNRAAGDGGALSTRVFSRGDVSLVDVRMFNNAAGGRGGAVAASSGGLAVEGGRYAQNSAGKGGGAFYAGNGFDTVSLSNLVVNRNVSRGNGAGRGGGMLLADPADDPVNFPDGSTITIDGVFAARNRAAGSRADGGALLILDRELIVRGSNFAGNGAERFGGNVAVFGGAAVFRDSFLRGGRAERGGGLWAGASRGDDAPSAVRFAGGGLIGNDAGRGGGAYLNRGGTRLTLDRGAVARGNRSRSGGGAAYLDRDALAVVADAVFRDNAPDDFAGPGALRR